MFFDESSDDELSYPKRIWIEGKQFQNLKISTIKDFAESNPKEPQKIFADIVFLLKLNDESSVQYRLSRDENLFFDSLKVLKFFDGLSLLSLEHKERCSLYPGWWA